ncbi:MAG: nucleotidyltransferase domain-containing protein [Nanoarchaeota archaeon]|nr:nucleotidyltransferase domain-containing protein [Nanoarchaeota archaeon]
MKKSDNYNLLILKVLELFVNNPYEEFYLREIARKLNINPNTAQRFLNYFLSENLVVESKKANLRYFKANIDDVVFRHIKKTYSIKKIMNSGLIDYLKNEEFNHVVLFGSVAKGENELKSDMDILCIGNKKKLDLEKYYKKLGEINVKIFSFTEWKKQKNDNKGFYEDVISTGINLIGEMPLV